MATFKNRDYVFRKDPLLGEALDDVLAKVANVAAQTVAAPTGVTPAPPQVSAVTVTAADGVFDAVISDNNPVSRGLNYFLEYSDNVGFTAPTVLDLGASRNWRGYLGNLTLYFRGYSQYPTSAPSAPTYFGNPTTVVGGGAAGPTPNPSAGSGTAQDNGEDGGSGFGKLPQRKQDSLSQ